MQVPWALRENSGVRAYCNVLIATFKYIHLIIVEVPCLRQTAVSYLKNKYDGSPAPREMPRVRWGQNSEPRCSGGRCSLGGETSPRRFGQKILSLRCTWPTEVRAPDEINQELTHLPF